MFTTYLFKVPEIPKRHVPEERKPVPVPKKEAPSVKGISTALVKKEKKTPKNPQTNCLSLHYFSCFLEYIYEFTL